MLKRIFVAVLLTLLLCLPAFAMKNEPDGFRGIKWGDRVSQHASLKGVSGNTYSKYNEKLQIGQCNVSRIFYHLDEKEGFFMVTVLVLDWPNIQQLNSECVKQWGGPKEDLIEILDDGRMVVEWKGAKATVQLIFDTEMAMLSISDNARLQRVVTQNKKYKSDF